jgi:hypothetical protein
MFRLLRAALLVGIIFYLSPVRQGGDPMALAASMLGWIGFAPSTEAPARPAEASAKLETMWRALPGSAKQAVVDEIVNRSGLGPDASKAPAADTLHAGDRKPAWRGEAHKPQG